MTEGYRDFEFDLPSALLTHLVRIFDAMETAPLSIGGLKGIPDGQGVYQLFLDEKLVYIGKTDAEAGLLKRLTRHSGKVLHRKGLDPGRLSFKAVRVFVFTAIDLETQLIKHYSGAKGKTAWNNSGFGANDPGRVRDKTRIKEANFDAMFPVDIDIELDGSFGGERAASQVAFLLKNSLPYVLRFQTEKPRSRQPHPILSETVVRIPDGARSARTVLVELTRQLPAGWQATAFRSHLILYRENVNDYPDAQVLARS